MTVCFTFLQKRCPTNLVHKLAHRQQHQGGLSRYPVQHCIKVGPNNDSKQTRTHKWNYNSLCELSETVVASISKDPTAVRSKIGTQLNIFPDSIKTAHIIMCSVGLRQNLLATLLLAASLLRGSSQPCLADDRAVPPFGGPATGSQSAGAKHTVANHNRRNKAQQRQGNSKLLHSKAGSGWWPATLTVATPTPLPPCTSGAGVAQDPVPALETRHRGLVCMLALPTRLPHPVNPPPVPPPQHAHPMGGARCPPYAT